MAENVIQWSKVFTVVEEIEIWLFLFLLFRVGLFWFVFFFKLFDWIKFAYVYESSLLLPF